MGCDVLVVEDDADLREALCHTLTRSGIRARGAPDGNDALRQLERGRAALVVSDVHMAPMNGLDLLRELRIRHGDVPVLLMTAFGSVPQAVQAMREGASDYLIKPFEAEVLLSKVSSYLDALAPPSTDFVAEDPLSRELLALTERVAASDVTVMLTGHSGTGKEVVARHVHRHSQRASAPFIAINCAAIPDNMLEAMLFGYEKGAFTGAYKASPGKFEQAQGGSLLLDEVSEMELGLQAKLLRVLQEREVERLGGSELIRLDVRVMATSNRDLRARVREGAFRADLYYRLNVFPLHVPALCERPQDIAPLARHLLARAARAAGRTPPVLSDEAAALLQAWSWPGNVRELDNVLQRALVLSGSATVGADFIRLERDVLDHEPADEDEGSILDAELREREQHLILDALRACGGNRKQMAERLGLSPRTLRYKLARMRDAGVALP